MASHPRISELRGQAGTSVGVKYKGCHCANRSLPRYWPVAEKDIRAIVSWADPEGAEVTYYSSGILS